MIRTRIPTLERLESRFALDGMQAGRSAEASLIEEARGNSAEVAPLVPADAVDYSIPLAGSVPQQVIISDRVTGALAWDYWHYSSTLDVLRFLPNGSFQIKHAESGEKYREGRLIVGSKLPSNRLFAERTDSETVVVDWGPLEAGQTIHVRVSDSNTVLLDEVRSDRGLVLRVPENFVRVEVTLPGHATEQLMLGTPALPHGYFPLSGTLPIQVNVINTVDGQMVIDRELSEHELDLRDLTDGNYVVQYSSSGQSKRSVGLAIAGNQVTQYSTALTLPGDVPRLIRITDATTNQRVWDAYHYSSSLDVVGLLPPGEYLLEHAASGEPWRRGVLKVGANVPSYRLLAERIDGDHVRFDWGFVSATSPFQVKIFDATAVLVEGIFSTTETIATVRNTFVQLDASTENYQKQTIFLGDPPSTLTRVSIPGTLPQQIQVVDTTTGQSVLETTLTTQGLDVNNLLGGHYVVYHTGLDQVRRSFQISLDDKQVVVQDTVLHLGGSYPRRFIVQDEATSVVVWDYWHYGPEWDVVGALPAGHYSLKHAASGESWQLGDITIGPGVSSYRIYTEHTSDGQLLIDWGNGGMHVGHRVRILADGEIAFETETAETRINIDNPGGVVITEVIPITEAETLSDGTPLLVTLTGQLPRHVTLIDTATGDVVVETEVTQAILNVSELPLGNYLLKHFADGEIPAVVSLVISPEGAATAETGIPIVGTLPQRIKITDQAAKEIIWDHYHYANVLDVMRILPEGVYIVEHGASGEPLKQGILQIGAKVPSYRLFAEVRETELLYVNWGPPGTFAEVRLQVASDEALIIDGIFSGREAHLQVPRGLVALEVSVPDGPQNLLAYCSLARLADDGSCRSFENSSKTTQVAGSNQGLVLSAWGLDEASSEFSILQQPQHGVLHQGDSTRIQTYIPSSGFVGVDSFTYRVATPDGQTTTALFTIEVTAPVEPDHAYFVPGFGTIHRDNGVPDVPEFVGNPLPRSILVNSDFSRLIERIEPDGTVLWRHQQPTFGRGVALIENEVVYTSLVDVRFLDVETGRLLRVLDLGLNAGDTLLFANPIDSQNLLVAWYDSHDISYLGIWNRSGQRIWTSAQTYVWPRWADQQGDIVVVADTYGHRLVGETISTHQLVFQISALWPGDVQIIGNHQVVLTEEHADRVWIYDWETGDRELIKSAPGPRTDLYMSFDFLVFLSNSTDLRIDPDSSSSQSKSSKVFSGTNTLYAPNGVSQFPDGSYLIADTDNSRVIHASRTGEILAELTGFNSPTKVAWIPIAADLLPRFPGRAL